MVFIDIIADGFHVGAIRIFWCLAFVAVWEPETLVNIPLRKIFIKQWSPLVFRGE